MTICTGMWRVAGSSLSWLSTVQPSMSGRKMSSEIAAGSELARQGERLRALGGDDALEADVARQAEQDARVVRVVLDDQQHRGRRPRCALRSSAMCSSRATGSTVSPARASRRRIRRRCAAALRTDARRRHSAAAGRA